MDPFPRDGVPLPQGVFSLVSGACSRSAAPAVLPGETVAYTRPGPPSSPHVLTRSQSTRPSRRDNERK